VRKEALTSPNIAWLHAVKGAKQPEGAEPSSQPPDSSPEPPPVSAALATALSLDEELAELSRIESHVKILKLTRPRTEEYLGQKQQEVEKRRRLRQAIVANIARTFELTGEGPGADVESRRRLVLRTDQLIDEIAVTRKEFLTLREKKLLAQDVLDEVLGLGPLEQFVRDDDISEIMVNGPFQIIVEKKGKLIQTLIQFDSEEHLRHVIDRIISPIGRRVDESSPIVDARLADGSRVNAVVPPLALDGSSLTIRKFAKVALEVADLIAFGALTPDMACFLQACVEARLNIVISGGTGSGKTTLLNTLASFIPAGERIVTIEDAAELQVKRHHEHVVRLESRPANIEGKGAVAIRDLVKTALRMRPDRIVVGECRGGEALDMLQAMNTGHDGSMTTGHANAPQDMIRRLETMVKMSGLDLPISAVREQIASAVHLIVQVSRLSDGSRKVTHITEVLGMDGEKVALRDLFLFRQSGVSKEGGVQGEHAPSGEKPRFLEFLREAGIELDERIFVSKPPAASRAIQIEREDGDAICVLRVGGAVDRSTMGKLDLLLRELAGSGPTVTYLSLENITLLDSAAIQLLSAAKRFYGDEKRHLLIRDLPDSVAEMLKALGLYENLVFGL
jgi:pilus assembly protein CpaF